MFFESFLLNLTVIVVLIFALIFDYVTKFFSYWYVRHINNRYPIPFFGCDYNRVLGLKSTTDEVESLCQKFPNDKLVGSIRSRIPDLIVKDADVIKLMLSKENFNSRGLCLDRSQDVCLRNNLFYSEGEKWNLLKKHLEPILKSMSQNFEHNERSFDKYLRDANGEINVQNFLEKLMDGVIKDLVFGERSGPEGVSIVTKLRSELINVTIASRFKSYLKSIFPSIYVLFRLNTLKWQSSGSFYKTLLNSELAEKTKGMKFEFSSDNKIKKGSNQENSNANIVLSTLSSFITEGYNPCLTTITCLLYELSKNEEVQNKIRSSDNQYLNNAINETVRLYPPYSIITRKCIKTFKFPESDLLIDKGVTITVPISTLHKDQKYFETPDVFNPDRFTVESGSKLTECSFLPYGYGSRQCIGQELSQLIISRVTENILKRYKVLPSPRTPQKLKFMDHNFARVLKSDVYLRFVPIKL